MTVRNIDAIEVLIHHGQHLLPALTFVNKTMIEDTKSVLYQKKTLDVIKALRDNKSLTSSRFPHLSKAEIMKVGAELRQSYAVLSHYRDFQAKTQLLLVDVVNECKNFDFSWNFIFTFPICRLFTLYVKLAVLITKMNEVERIPLVYDYCYRMKTEKPEAAPTELIAFLKERSTLIKLTSELQLVQSNFYGLFKSIATIMYHLLTAGQSYQWSYLNLSDNPSEFDELEREFPFFKPEYVVMMHIQELCECFVCYIITNYGAIVSDPLFLEVLMLIIAHQPILTIYGTTALNIYKLLEDVRKIRGKKSEIGYLLPEKIDELTKNYVSTRYFRCRKLTMILEEVINSYGVSKDVLASKFVIINSALGFAHHTATSILTTYHADNKDLDAKHKNTDVIPLLYKMSHIVSLIIKNAEDIKRFIAYNLHEYDAPYLQHMIQSFNIPTTEYNRFVVIYNALMSLNIEEYDRGQKYDLAGLEMCLKRVMGSFNKFSTSHGVLHLAPLFNLLSSMHFRVKSYNLGELFFTEVCPINEYYRFIPIFGEIIKLKDSSNASSFPAILMISHFYSVNTTTIKVFPKFKESIKKHVDLVIKEITSCIYDWAASLQKDGLQQLIEQTSVTKVLTKNGVYEKANKRLPISETKPGDESLLKSRQQLTPIHSKLQLISDLFKVFREIGQIKLFDEEINVLDTMNKTLSDVMVKLFDSEKIQTPFRFIQLLESTRFIISYIMTAARIDPSPFIYKVMNQITYAPIQEENQITVINQDKLGKMAGKYIKFYRQFFKKNITESFYSTNSQSFLNQVRTKDNKFKADIIQVFASKSAIRTILEILSISGIACIDIVAAESITELFDDFAKGIKSCMNGDEAPFVKDPLNLPKAGQLLSIVTQIGSICKFRQLLRQTVPQEEAVGQYAFLSNKITPETDTIFISRIKNHEIIKMFKHPSLIPTLFRALCCSADLGNTSNYSTENDAFIKNYHLIGLCIDTIVGAIISETDSFNYVEFYTNLVSHMYEGIKLGKENIELKKVETWNTRLLCLILDHFAQISYYLDYSILEPILPYHLIRAIYTRCYSKGGL